MDRIHRVANRKSNARCRVNGNNYMCTRTQILVRGIVQGVGFRPYVFSLATKSSLKGQVLNNAMGVLIDIEGEAQTIEKFIADLRLKPPPLSTVETIESKILTTPAYYKDFRIVESNGNGAKSTPVSADTATCADCLREMSDPQDRRYRYPFINCTNCGPRFTIIESVPYDRSRTTMREFEMCVGCLAEYKDPSNRRFHAEPTCCPNCGPQLFLSEPPAVAGGSMRTADTDLVRQTQRLLLSGKIIAIKGLGGYHLACDALNQKAVETLRKRKYREDKPFALMASSLGVIEKHCFISDAEKELLLSPERPIVLLNKKKNTRTTGCGFALDDIPEAVAPRMNTLGFMLPYTPLHYLLFENLDRPIVMTSGNVSDEPICYQDADARERLTDIADYYLLHDRKIYISHG
jgi:Hydrogenase maturation factor